MGIEDQFLQIFRSGLHNFQHELAQEKESFKENIVRDIIKIFCVLNN